MDFFDLSADVAVVIGGTGILGGAIAEGLASAGARVAIVGRNAQRGEARTNTIRQAGGQAEFFAADTLERASLVDCQNRIAAALGPVTILLNGAGGNEPAATVGSNQTFEQLPLEAWTRNFDLNLVGGVLLPCQVFGPGMVERRLGSIINIASVSAHVALSRVVAYSAAKAAVLNLTQFLAREWATSGVRVNSITPGFFPAEQNRQILFEPDGTPTARARSIFTHTPMQRFGEPRELVGAAIFLASRKASSFVTGTDLRVDGGFLSTTI
ncbi:MAG: SDR family oxidoreductase [Verrucomicrobia bacterium]|nr:SDR family oxidoreductase [Verrucomicrobiota bacterium]